MANSRKGPIVLTVAAVVVVLAGAIWFFFIRSDAPPAVDLDTATDQLTSTTSGSSTTSTAPEGIDGTWVVDTETGDFDFETATGSFAGFRVTEELAQIGSSEAVGRTGEVTGTMQISDGTLQSAEIEVDLTSIESDTPRRDGRVQDALGTDEFPTATFTLTEPVELPTGAAQGEAISVRAPGELTVNGVTNAVTADLEAQLVDGTAVVVGSIEINFADFDIEAPSAPVVLSVSDEATVEFQLLFTPQTDQGADTPSTSGDPSASTTTDP
ncbi:MAG: YceI family protein [Microthrixaceae bacterium]